MQTVNGEAEKFTREEGPDGSGYRPVEPSLVRERMDILDERVNELRTLAAERRRRLDDNKRLCQFWWDLADLENNFREQEQVLALTDTGRDIVSVNRLLAKHRNAERNLDSLGNVLENLEGQVSIVRLNSVIRYCSHSVP